MVTEHLNSNRERKTQRDKYCVPHHYAWLETKALETVLSHQCSLRGLFRKRISKNLGKSQKKARAKARRVQQTQAEKELLKNRNSLPSVLELLWGMCFLLPKRWIKFILKKIKLLKTLSWLLGNPKRFHWLQLPNWVFKKMRCALTMISFQIFWGFALLKMKSFLNKRCTVLNRNSKRRFKPCGKNCILFKIGEMEILINSQRDNINHCG